MSLPSPTRVERCFDALLGRDGAGGSWLSALLRATPGATRRLGELTTAPGWLEATIAVRTETGRRGAFEYRVTPSRRLLAWYIDHPHALRRPADVESTPETLRLRRALLDDEPPGTRALAQDRAHEQLRRSDSSRPVWWRFEEVHRVDCVLITDRLVLLVSDGERAATPTPWFPQRSARVRDLEAAQRIAEPARSWGVLTVHGADAESHGRDRLASEIAAGAPHLDDAQRAELLAGDLGELTWPRVAEATGADAD